MKPRAILLGIAVVALACGACGKKEESLSLLVWEGYSDDAAVHDFEQSHHCKIHSSFMGSSDELVAKLRRQRFQLRRHFPFERRGRLHHAYRPGRATRSFETAFVPSALFQAS